MVGRRIGLVLFVVVMAGFVACGEYTEPEPRPVASIGSVDDFTCALPQDVVAYQRFPGSYAPSTNPRPIPGTVPDSFVPAEAVVCDIDLAPRIGADGVATYFERHYSGDFGSAIQAFNAPSARRAFLPGSCGDYSLAAPVDMWLVDADGRAVQPSYPLWDCGFENTTALGEVLELPEKYAVQHTVAIDAAGIEYFYHCSPVYSAPVDGTEEIDFPFWPSGFCYFDNVGQSPAFANASMFSTSDISPDWEALLRGLEHAVPCSERSNSIATSSSGMMSLDGTTAQVHVELDGCKRILADGYAPLAAPDYLVDSIATERG